MLINFNGQAGTGKTVLCATTPNLKNTIYFCLKLKRQRRQSDQMATNPPDTKYHTKDRSGKLDAKEPANLSIIQQKILGA